MPLSFAVLLLFFLGLALTMSVVFATTTILGRPSVVTTTLYKAPPSAIATPTQNLTTGNGIPVAAIAGGVAAGVVLAIGATIAWIWWGRSIDRAAEKQRRETTRALVRTSHVLPVRSVNVPRKGRVVLLFL